VTWAVYSTPLSATSAQLELIRDGANYGAPTNRPVQESTQVVTCNWQAVEEVYDPTLQDNIDVGYALLWLLCAFSGCVILVVIYAKCTSLPVRSKEEESLTTIHGD
jgi:hypothetical protein